MLNCITACEWAYSLLSSSQHLSLNELQEKLSVHENQIQGRHLPALK